MEARSSNNSVDIWSPTYLVGHKGPWKLPKKVLLPGYLKQMDISDYSESTTATLENDEQSWYKDTLDRYEIYELQQGVDESQNHSIILICIKYVCSVMPLRLIIN